MFSLDFLLRVVFSYVHLQSFFFLAILIFITDMWARLRSNIECECVWIVRRNYVCKMQRHYRKRPSFLSLRDESIYGVFNTFNCHLKEQTGVNMSEISSFYFLILLVNVAAKITISNDPHLLHQPTWHSWISLSAR